MTADLSRGNANERRPRNYPAGPGIGLEIRAYGPGIGGLELSSCSISVAMTAVALISCLVL